MRTRAKLVEAVVIGLALLQLRMDGIEQIVQIPTALASLDGIIFARESPEFRSPTRTLSNILMQAALHGEVEPFLRARFHLEGHAGAYRRIRSKRMGWLVNAWMESARTSCRSRSARPLIGSSSRPRDCVFSEIAMALIGEIAAAQILHDSARNGIRLYAGPLVDIVARRGN